MVRYWLVAGCLVAVFSYYWGQEREGNWETEREEGKEEEGEREKLPEEQSTLLYSFKDTNPIMRTPP